MDRVEFYQEYLKYYLRSKSNTGHEIKKKGFYYFSVLFCLVFLTSFSPTTTSARSNSSSELGNKEELEKLQNKVDNIVHVLNFIIEESEQGNSLKNLGLKSCKVKVDKLMIRAKPRKDSSGIMAVGSGAELLINEVDASGNWYQVIAPSGEYGWVVREGVEKVK